MKRNAYKGIPARRACKCDTCGAEFELGNRRPGEPCGGTLNFKYPFKTCTGKMIPLKP